MKSKVDVFGFEYTCCKLPHPGCYFRHAVIERIDAPNKSLAAVLIKQAINLAKGSGEPNRNKVGKISSAQIREIAEKKMPDLNANDLDAASKIIEGTARSMGVEVKG